MGQPVKPPPEVALVRAVERLQVALDAAEAEVRWQVVSGRALPSEFIAGVVDDPGTVTDEEMFRQLDANGRPILLDAQAALVNGLAALARLA